MYETSYLLLKIYIYHPVILFVHMLNWWIWKYSSSDVLIYKIIYFNINILDVQFILVTHYILFAVQKICVHS